MGGWFNLLGYLHMTPGFVRIERHEQIGSAVTAIFAIATFVLTRSAADRLTDLSDRRGRTVMHANHRAL